MDRVVNPTTRFGLLYGELLQVVQVPQDVQGQFTFTVPGGYWYRWLTFQAVIDQQTTGPIVFPGYDITDGSRTVFSYRAQVGVTPPAPAQIFAAIRRRPGSSSNAAAAILAPLPWVWMAPGWTIAAAITGNTFGPGALTAHSAAGLVDRISTRDIPGQYHSLRKHGAALTPAGVG